MPGRARSPREQGLRGRDSDARLAAILMVLIGSGHANGDELAARFGVAPRTIYRDIEELKRRGLPIVSSVGPGGGYVLRAKGDEDGLPLTHEASLVSLLTDSGPLAAVGRTHDVGSVLDRAEAALKDSEKLMLARVRERIYFDTDEWYVRDYSEPNLDRIRDAVMGDHRVRVRFIERNGSLVEETLDPIGLVWKGGFWYLFAATPTGVYRRVRVERIEGVVDTGETFHRPTQKLVDMWRADLERFGVGTITVRMVITGSAIREFKKFNWKRENKITKAKDRWDVEMHVDSYEWLVPLALSYAGDVEIQEPDVLRGLVLRAATAVARKHGATSSGTTIPSEAISDAPHGDIRSRALRGRAD